MPNEALFKYLDKNNEEKALKAVTPEDIHTYIKSSGDYALHLAIKKRFINLACTLIKFGASPYVLNEENENPLSLVISQNGETKEAVTILLKSKAPVTEDIGSAILTAVMQNEVEVTRIMLEKAGSDIAKQVFTIWTQENEDTCLHIAVNNRNLAMIELLMSYHADPFATNDAGKSPLDLAKDAADNEIIRRFLSKASNNALSGASQNNRVKETVVATDSNQPNITTSERRGRTRKKYLDFAKFISKKEINMEELFTLGMVDNQPEYYFQISQKSNNYARKFLALFFSDSKNVKLAQDFHQSKYEKERQKNPAINTLHPSCISFITATVNGKNYCFVAPSLVSETELFQKLCQFTNELNQSGKLDDSYVVLGGEISHYNEILRSFMKDNYMKKGCSEKYYSKFLTKLYLEHGKGVYIEGITTVTILPQERNVEYGNRSSDAFNKIVRPYPNGIDFYRRIKIGNDFFVTILPCCEPCQKNKSSIFKIFKGAQEYGKEYSEAKALGYNKQRLELSPIRNSIFTFFQEDRKEDAISNCNTSIKEFKK